MNGRSYIIAAAFILFSLPGLNAYSSSTDSSAWDTGGMDDNPARSYYDQGMEATKNKDFGAALNFFDRAAQRDRNNPDVLNMLAHSQLKLGMIDESLDTYKRALSLRPKFPEAREYLGEAYIQAALREIKNLESYGGDAAENLEDLKKAFKEAAADLN